MKIKFKNGYSVEVNDSYLKTMPKREIINRARQVVDELCSDADNEPMVIIKKVKTPKGYKIMIIKNNAVTGIKRFDLDAEEEAQDFYDRLADKYNLDEEGYDDFGRTKIAAPARYFKMQKVEDSVKRKSVKDMYEPIETFKTFEFLDKTRQGFKVVEAYEDLDDGRMHVICYRPSDKTYIIGLGYNADNGTWNQGRYDYRTIGDAERALKKDYNVDVYEVDLSKFEDKVQIEDISIDYQRGILANIFESLNRRVAEKDSDGFIKMLNKLLYTVEGDLKNGYYIYGDNVMKNIVKNQYKEIYKYLGNFDIEKAFGIDELSSEANNIDSHIHKVIRNINKLITDSKSKKIEDTPINYTEELGFAITPSTINKLVSKKTGKALNPTALRKALNYLETDIDYDIEVRAPKWADPKNTTTDPRVVQKIIAKYEDFVDELNKIDDDSFNDKAQAIIDKVETLKSIVYNIDDTGPDVNPEEENELFEEEKVVTKEETPVKEVIEEKKTVVEPKEETPVIKLSGKKKEIPLEEDEDESYVEDACEDACKDSDIDDIYIEDTPVAGETVHASVEGAPDHAFNKNILVRGNSRALSSDETDAAYGRRLLSGEYEDVKQTLLYDIAHAGEVAAVTPKYLLHMGMDKYKEIVDLFNVPGLEREYAELMKLYNKLYYNGYYLGVRGN